MSTNELNIFVPHQLSNMIAVTGASGMLGAHFIFELTKKHNKVVALKRDQSNITWIKSLFVFLDKENGLARWNKVVWRDADLNDVFSLTDALHDATTVYHCAAVVDFVRKRKAVIIESNVQGTANLVDALIELPQEVKLLHVSSIAALGKPETGNTVTATTEWKEDEEQSAYAVSKYYSELEAWRGANEGLKVISVLPGLILGCGHKKAPSMAPFIHVKKGKKRISDGTVGLVPITDVVNQSIALIQNEEAIGKRYVLVADNWSFKQWFQVIAEAMQQAIVFRVLSRKKLQQISLLERFYCLFTGKPRKLKASTINALTNTNEYDGSEVVEVTDIKYTSIQKQIKEIVEWQKLMQS